MAEKRMVLTADTLQKRVQELGWEISREYGGKKPLLVGVLNGAFIFLADLVRQIDIPCEIDFVRVASYGKNDTAGSITLTKDVEKQISGRSVILVEDIVDTGNTIAFLQQLFSGRQADSVRICALIDKKERRQVPVPVDYVGFDVAEGFLVGYGLDFAEQHRHYPHVYHLVP